MVTGGTGFVGTRVLPRLVAAGWDVAALARSSRSAESIVRLGAEPISGDLDDPDSVTTAFVQSGATHLANIASLGFGHASTIVAAAEAAQVRRAVFVSTTAIFTKLNAGSKEVRLAAEDAVRKSTLDYVVLRPTMIYGAHDDRNICRLVRLIERSPVVPVPGGRRLQQPVHVDDVAWGVVRALDEDVVGRVFLDIPGAEPIAFRDLVKETAAASGRRIVAVPLPLPPLLAGARLYERFSRRPRLKAEQFERLAEDKVFDLAPAESALGYMPRAYVRGIRDQVEEMQSRRRSSGTAT